MWAAIRPGYSQAAQTWSATNRGRRQDLRSKWTEMALLSLSRWRIAVLSKFQLVRPELGLYAHHQAGDYLHVGSHRIHQNPSKGWQKVGTSGRHQSMSHWNSRRLGFWNLLEHLRRGVGRWTSSNCQAVGWTLDEDICCAGFGGTWSGREAAAEVFLQGLVLMIEYLGRVEIVTPVALCPACPAWARSFRKSRSIIQRCQRCSAEIQLLGWMQRTVRPGSPTIKKLINIIYPQDLQLCTPKFGPGSSNIPCISFCLGRRGCVQ